MSHTSTWRDCSIAQWNEGGPCDAVCWTLEKEPLWGTALGNRICYCSDFTEQQGVGACHQTR